MKNCEASVRAQFGNRCLEDPSSVFEHNAWDNVPWDEVQVKEAVEKVKANSAELVSPEVADDLESKASEFWDKFYDQHENRFFKDRNWLFTEFPELVVSDFASTSFESTSKEELKSECTENNLDYPGKNAKLKILEVGCGVGNTVFPILQANGDSQDLFVYCCDFSSKAVQLVKAHEKYDNQRCYAFVWDVTVNGPSGNGENGPFPLQSLDVIVMIFILSAVQPDKMEIALRNLVKYLKPGGVLLFRDYGQLDLAQLRFKNGQCISENFYVRQDGTRVYFFTQDELDELFRCVGLEKEVNIVDRRLIVNRGKKLKMYRVWIQCRYRKK